MATFRRCLRRGQGGQAMVEYALGHTIAMLLIMGVVDLGRAFFSNDIITYATGQAGVGGITVTVPSRGTAGDPNSPAVIQASYSFTAITPLIGQICCNGGAITLAARSSMYVEN